VVGWYNVIQTRREEHAEEHIIRPFVDRMIEYGILPPPTTEDYQIMWVDLFAASDKEQAEIGRIRATALREYSQNPTAEMIIPPEAFMRLMLGLDESEMATVQHMVDDDLEEELREIAKGNLIPKDGAVPAPTLNTGDNE